MKQPSSSLRLDRLLANLGYGTRKEIQALAKAGCIHLDGAPLSNAAGKIAITANLPERLAVAGEKLDPLPGLVLMMNKPAGVTCSHREAGALVYDLLPARWRVRKPAISTVGRLDKDTSGLLLLTDEGALLHRIIAPKSKIAKRYRVVLARPLKGDEAEIFASGRLLLEGEDKPLLPAVLDVADSGAAHAYGRAAASVPALPESCGPVVFVTITEGRYHQVRRMFAALGNHVTALHRVCIGGLSLPDDLGAGAYRLLAAADVDSIFNGAVILDKNESAAQSGHAHVAVND